MLWGLLGAPCNQRTCEMNLISSQDWKKTWDNGLIYRWYCQTLRFSTRINLHSLFINHFTCSSIFHTLIPRRQMINSGVGKRINSLNSHWKIFPYERSQKREYTWSVIDQFECHENKLRLFSWFTVSIHTVVIWASIPVWNRRFWNCLCLLMEACRHVLGDSHSRLSNLTWHSLQRTSCTPAMTHGIVAWRRLRYIPQAAISRKEQQRGRKIWI